MSRPASNPMKTPIPLALLLWVLLLACPAALHAQTPQSRISKIVIRHVGPPAVSDEFIRENIRSKAGEVFARATVDEDVKSLWATGYFFKVLSDVESTPDGLILTFRVQGKPILTDIKIVGNKLMKLKKLKKKITSKEGQPL